MSAAWSSSRSGGRGRLAIGNSLQGAWKGLPRPGRYVIGAVGVALLYLLPQIPLGFIETQGTKWDSVLFFPILVYVMMAVGLNIVVGRTGLLDLGFVAFFAIGAYSTAVLGGQHDWSWWLVLPAGVALAMGAGVILGTPTLRLRGDYLAIVTLGFGEIIRLTANNTESIGGPRGISDIPVPPDVGGLEFDNVLDDRPFYWLGLTLLVLMVFVVRRLERSRVGRAWTAIREDEDAAELMGVPTFTFKLWAFAIGAGIGGAGGTLYASQHRLVSPGTFQLILSILFLAAVVLGGSGNLVGVIVGAAMIAYLPERFRGFEDKRVMIFGIALVVMMIFRPQGLIPSRRRAAELEDPVTPPEMADMSASGQELAGYELGEVFGPGTVSLDKPFAPDPGPPRGDGDHG